MAKLNSKSLKKKLPEGRIEQVREGTVSVDELTDELLRRSLDMDIVQSSCGAAEQIISFRSLNDSKSITKRKSAIFCDMLSKHAIPGEGGHVDDLRRQFLKSFLNACNEYREHKEKNSPILSKYESTYHFAFDKACDEFKRRIIRKCYGGRKKEFQLQCVAYKVSSAEFRRVTGSMFRETVENHPCRDIIQHESAVRKVAEHFQEGNDNQTRICWGCNEVVNRRLICTGCLGAVYCGQECQIKAWKGGHRYSCSVVKRAFENLKNNQRAIKEARLDPNTHEQTYGYRPNFRFDSLLMRLPFQEFLEADGDVSRIDFPSIETFYSNLSLVKRGMLWTNASASSTDETSEKNEELEVDPFEMVRNGLALSYPYGDSQDSDQDHRLRSEKLRSNWQLGSIPSEGYELPKADNCTATDFLQMYYTWVTSSNMAGILKDQAVAHAYLLIRSLDKSSASKALEEKQRKKVTNRKNVVLRELLSLKMDSLESEQEDEAPDINNNELTTT